MEGQKFRKLEVWIKAMALVEDIYKVTDSFPASETYGLLSQIRRAALSVALNIAEGSGSGSDIEFRRFLSIALRSAYEVICGIEIAKRLNYSENDKSDCLISKCDEISAMIFGFRKKLISKLPADD